MRGKEGGEGVAQLEAREGGVAQEEEGGST